MDDETLKILKRINAHVRIKYYLTVLCYLLIASGLFFYIFHAINQTSHTIKLVTDYKENPQKFKTSKEMTNPSIDFQYNKNDIYHIQAKKAYHENEKEVTMFDVSATGAMGDITAGELKISEQGDRLIFTDHPVLILKQTGQIHE